MAEDLHSKYNQVLKRLADHELKCQAEFKLGTDRYDTIMEFEVCAKDVCELKTNTAGIVQIYNDVTGAGRTFTRLQSFVLFITKWLGIPSAAYVILKVLWSKLPPPL